VPFAPQSQRGGHTDDSGADHQHGARAPIRRQRPQRRLGRLHPGMKVAVYTDSSPAKPYAGKIGYISPQAEFTPKNVETAELRTSLVYRLRVVVENADDSLRQGMPVTVHPLPE